MDPTRDTAWAGALGATRTLPRTPTVGIAVARADMTKAILQLSVVERCCECTGAATSDSGRLFGDVALSTKVAPSQSAGYMYVGVMECTFRNSVFST